jgi:hypothetical protein
MPIPLNPVTMKKLVLVKQLYQQAYLHSEARSSPVSRIIAVVTFDLATETMLKTIVSALDPEKDPDKQFQGLIQSADSMLAPQSMPPVPDKAQIQHVHSIRNDAQHKAKYPTEDDVNHCRTYIRDFLEHITLQVWDANFDEISLTDLIQHPKIKELLIKTEACLKSGDYVEAIAYAKVTFSRCINLVIKKVIGELPHFLGTLSSPRDSQVTFETMKTMLMLQTLGLSFAEYAKYQQASSSVLPVETQDDGIRWRFKSEIVTETEEDAKFVVSYVIDAILQVENYVGDIEKPFGITYR